MRILLFFFLIKTPVVEMLNFSNIRNASKYLKNISAKRFFIDFFFLYSIASFLHLDVKENLAKMSRSCRNLWKKEIIK